MSCITCAKCQYGTCARSPSSRPGLLLHLQLSHLVSTQAIGSFFVPAYSPCLLFAKRVKSHKLSKVMTSCDRDIARLAKRLEMSKGENKVELFPAAFAASLNMQILPFFEFLFLGKGKSS